MGEAMRRRTSGVLGACLSLLILALVACGRLHNEEEAEGAAGDRADAGDAGAQNAGDAGLLDAQANPYAPADASVQIHGAVCSSREPVHECQTSTTVGTSSPNLWETIETCVRADDDGHRSPCIRLQAAVDGTGCVTDLFIEWGAEKVEAVQCIADVVSTRRWPCAQEGTYLYYYGCTLEK